MEEKTLTFDWSLPNIKLDCSYRFKEIRSPIFPNELIDNEKSQHLWFLKLTTNEVSQFTSAPRQLVINHDAQPTVQFTSSRVAVGQPTLHTRSYISTVPSLSTTPTPQSKSMDLSLCLAWAKSKYYFCTAFEIKFKFKCHADWSKISSKKHMFHMIYNPTWIEKVFISSTLLQKVHSNEFLGPLQISCRMKIQIEKCTICTNPKEIPEFESMFNNEEYSDFTVLTTGKEYKVHKAILATRSEVFAAMFQNEMKEKKEGVVKITDFDDEVVAEFLKYMYCGKVEDLEKLSEDLLKIADKYSVQGLRTVCLEELYKKITTENAVELLSLIGHHKVDHLKTFVINFIVINVKKIDESHFKLLSSVDLMQEIFLKTRNSLL